MSARLALVGGILAATLALPAAPAMAAVQPRRIDVFHSPGSLGRAIDRARPGDVLRVHRGRYREVLVIDVPITVKAVGRGRVIVDGRCRTGVVIDVQSDGVTLKGLTVQGADIAFNSLPSEVSFSGVGEGAAKRLVLRDTCDAEYGINVFGTGRMLVRNSVARGFSDGGLYVGGIEDGPVTLARNETFASNRGIIVEDSLPGCVTVIRNDVHDNGAPGESPTPGGIAIIRTDGVAVVSNLVRSSLVYGISADADSTGNLIHSNDIAGSRSLDAFDDSGSNCWNGTVAATRDPDPLPTC
jgi:nitrous oxidase accessory protein NosD